MALSNVEKQQRYIQRVRKAGLVRLQTFVRRDIDDAIDVLAAKFQKPRYAVVEYAIKRLVMSFDENKLV